MQYGDIVQSKESLFMYMGTDPANDNYTYVDDNTLRPSTKAVNQRDADLLHFWHKVFFFFYLSITRINETYYPHKLSAYFITINY